MAVSFDGETEIFRDTLRSGGAAAGIHVSAEKQSLAADGETLCFAVVEIVDAFTDVFAGWLVDNTHTKWGTGRTYEPAIVGMTICTVLLFSASPEWSNFAKCAWIFCMYTFTFSIFATLRLASANPRYQSGKCEKGDWTESYQAVYHEHMLKMWAERPYIWAMHCWNGFDFGADGRDEGGKPGQNQKGLITFDRKTKKDAFYIYKAYLSDEPFVHLCGRRYIDCAEETTEIKVYSNLPEVSLTVDGQPFETKNGDKVFTFRVPISGEHSIEAEAGGLRDSITVRKVEKANPDYVKPGTQVTNWFDREDEIVKEGFFSIKDSMSAVKAHDGAKAVLDKLLAPLQAKIIEAYGDVAKNVQLPPEVQAMMDKMSVEASLKQMGKLVTPEFVHKLNNALNQVKK